MQMEILFPGGKKVFAEKAGFTIQTDQPEARGGDNSAPSPFDLFLASIGTCVGIFALSFMQQRDIDPTGSKILVDMDYDAPNMRVNSMDLNLVLPDGFPEHYRDAILHAMNGCVVKKHLENPPTFTVRTTDAGA